VPRTGPQAGVLLAGVTEENQVPLKKMIEPYGWAILESAGCAGAVALMRTENILVTICEPDLPDGSWRSLVADISTLSFPPHLIVASRLADEQLWAEVLNLGAYDLLMLPFDTDEARRVIGLAWESKCREYYGRRVKGRPPGMEPAFLSTPQTVHYAWGD